MFTEDNIEIIHDSVAARITELRHVETTGTRKVVIRPSYGPSGLKHVNIAMRFVERPGGRQSASCGATFDYDTAILLRDLLTDVINDQGTDPDQEEET